MGTLFTREVASKIGTFLEKLTICTERKSIRALSLYNNKFQVDSRPKLVKNILKYYIRDQPYDPVKQNMFRYLEEKSINITKIDKFILKF